jgi:rsbT co-antagonist protein RsbR
MSERNLGETCSVLEQYEESLLEEWLKEQAQAFPRQSRLLRENEQREQSAQFIRLLRDGLKHADQHDVSGTEFEPLRELLSSISRSRSQRGFSPSETAMYIFSFKQPLFFRLRERLVKRPERLAEEIWEASRLLDRLGLHVTDAYQAAREEVIIQQQQELMELSTPVVTLWKGILALPLIGTLDSARTGVVMESLLQKISETGADVAIIDITGVPTVDTLVAQHLLKTVTAARLMGAECIISGIRPQIAQTIVHLGVNLGEVVTKSSLADALRLALTRKGLAVGSAIRAGSQS